MGKSMSIREVVASLREQVPDSGKPARDAEALKIAAEALDRLEAAMEILAWVPGGEKEKFSAEERIRLIDAFNALSDRERRVLIMLNGLDRGIPASPAAVAKAFGVTCERIRQIEHRALEKLLFAVSGTHVIDLLRSCAAEIMEREGVGNESR